MGAREGEPAESGEKKVRVWYFCICILNNINTVLYGCMDAGITDLFRAIPWIGDIASGI